MKGKLREEMCRRMREKGELGEASKTIQEKILNAEEFAKAKCVFCYISKQGEVETHGIIKRAFECGKRVVVPKVIGKQMIACEIGTLDGLERGNFGVLEPKWMKGVEEKYIELALVPGVAFDEKGERLGRGKGYFDSFVPKLKCLVIGLAFDCQVVDELPVEAHDAKVDVVLTEKRTLVFKTERIKDKHDD